MDSNKIKFYTEIIGRIKHLLALASVKEKYRTSSKAFTRNRTLPFSVTVLFLLNLNKRALQDELDEYFKVLKGDLVANQYVTKSALSQARLKVKPGIFIYLNKTVLDAFYESGEPYLWHGFRLLAIDGSMSTLPDNEKIRAHFGVWHPNAGGECPKARVSQMYDVQNKVTVDALIVPKKYGERFLAEKHLKHCQASDLLLLDRGYDSFCLFADMISRKVNFCARMSVSGWRKTREFVASGKKENILLFKASGKSIKECHQRGLPTTIRLRLIRVDLPTGEVEVLVTTLFDQTRFPHEVFQDLYHQRWYVEEDYKVLKLRTEFENWTGKSVQAIQQDFYAKVLSKNIAFIFAHHAQPVVKEQTAHRQYEYQVNMTNLISKMKDTIVLLLTKTEILPILEALWEQMVRTIEPIRPGRSVPRKKKVKPPRYSFSYKGTR